MPKRLLEKFTEVLKSWGMDISVPRPGNSQRRLVVLIESGGTPMTVGSLSQEDGTFVFRYDPAFRDRRNARPISAFPDLGGEYRSEVLFPFFQVRVPPSERADVRQLLLERRIDPTDVLRVLAEIGGRSPTSPYIFKFDGSIDASPASLSPAA